LLGTTRSAFTRDALRHYLSALKEHELEKRRREGYMKKPVKPDEFDDWEPEQIWPD
jgi:metal-responsive CopG/Arc/MetJ family transcriptional regulator